LVCTSIATAHRITHFRVTELFEDATVYAFSLLPYSVPLYRVSLMKTGNEGRWSVGDLLEAAA
jgi:hypothetical protein